MGIKLPPMPNGNRLTISDNQRQITIIGANGAGKTRFTEALASEFPQRAYRVSALQAIYGQGVTADKAASGSIDEIYFKATEASPLLRKDVNTQIDRLFSVLVYQELINLIGNKVEKAANNDIEPQITNLDRLIKMWQEVFPENRALLEEGRLIFQRGTDSDSYGSVKLSDGEKAVLYYIGAALLAMENAIIFVDSPGLFLHPSISQTLWNAIEAMRPDCTFVYTTHDIMFASSRTDNVIVWVRDYDAATITWKYDLLPADSGIPDDVYIAIIGGRKPVLFIEGDGVHSIDSKLYPLVFTGYTVKPLGSCNKVIETTRTFNDMTSFHHLDSHGIVDRDRRDEKEVAYLREKKILVPDVAEIENILMLEQVVRAVAAHYHKDENAVFAKVKKSIIGMFANELKQQALLHTRHRVKRTVEHRIDGRFHNINNLEDHMNNLVNEINPRGIYEELCRKFHEYVDRNDYRAILRVFNQKTMIQASNVAGLCGLRNREDYIKNVISILKNGGRDGQRIRLAVLRVFKLDDTPTPQNK